jgi:ferredoxin-NADP reductase
MLLTLTDRRREGDAVESFRFQPDQAFDFKAGQYLKYTLPHPESDSRGVSRFFTIASAPAEDLVMLTTRLSTPGSTFKQMLQQLEKGAVIEATGPFGRFVYSDYETPAVFIAGGIGITPFRSILMDLASRASQADVTLLYANNTPSIPFRRLLDDLARERPSWNIAYTVSHPDAEWRGPIGRIDGRFIREHASLTREPLFYVSGPKAMVTATTETLEASGVAAGRIKQDFFPGYDS